jgi:hypothetical protein
MAFHRFTTPSYFGGLPGGYDLINVTSGGTGAGGSAFADVAKIGGPNAGTYWIAFGEDATSSNTNRGFKALAENCDSLDDLMRRDLAVPTRTVDATAGGAVSSIVITGQTFVGVPGTPATAAGIGTVFSIVDDSDNEIIDPTTGAKVQVTSITGATVGTNFTAGPVTLNLTPSIPAGVTYRVYYGTRGNLATMATDVLTTIRIRGAQEIEAGVEDLFRRLQGNALAWNAAWTTTIYDLAASTLDDRYRLSTLSDYSAINLGTLDTPGSGAIILRDGIAPQVRTVNAGVTDRTFPDPINACWKADMVDRGKVGGATARADTSLGSVAFAAYGTPWSLYGENQYTPPIASFMSLQKHRNSAAPAASGGSYKLLTNIPANSNANIIAGGSGEYFDVTLTGTGIFPNAFVWVDLGAGVKATSIVKNRDLMEVKVGSVTRTFVVVNLHATDPTKFSVAPLDGGVIGSLFAGSTGCQVTWITTQMYLGNGAPGLKYKYDGSPGVTYNLSDAFDGFYLVEPAIRSTDNTVAGDSFYNPISANPLMFLGRITPSAKALSVGYFNFDPTVATHVEGASLTAEGVFTGFKSLMKQHRPTGINSISISGGADPQDIVASFVNYDTVLVTASVSRAIGKIQLEMGAAGLATGASIQLLIYHTFAGPGALTGPTAWTPSISTVDAGSVQFSSPADAVLTGLKGYVDWYRFTNIGSPTTPVLVATVTRVGQGLA